MEVFRTRLVVAPATTAIALVFILGGLALGTLSGLTPGVHVNNLALLLASVAPAVPGPPKLVGAAMLAAGVVHSFLDVVPTLALVPGHTSARGFVVATSGVNTANTIFALFALVALGTPRTGVMVALQETNAPLTVPVLLVSVAVAGVVGFVLVLALGDRYLRAVGRMDYRVLSLGVLSLLVVASFLFAGLFGIGIFLVSTALGLFPPRVGCRRVHLMGVLVNYPGVNAGACR
ncbi:tripartite tricarboxylate transporter permease [Haladaptatus sp. NG-WS-4]